ncbi:SMI1/KNR4 family protein [Nocardia sp. NBC_01327]|uniref:SMI1/KNR4 family protein n=1 Tax=Nocardia sp. NBC_01327 TaxID=2903593 RepID=UPI002E117219|nr:SMI1/KNR4 family protein [Nocardia sp. NBC_01327]
MAAILRQPDTKGRNVSDWRTRLQVLYELQKKVNEAQGLPGPSPLVTTGASEQAIAAAEQRLGVVLDSSYSDVLRAVNGWPSFALSWNLFAAEDLGQSHGLWAEANRDATAYFDGEGDHAVTVPRGRKRVLLAAGADSARFLVGMLDTAAGAAASPCYDCAYGEDIEYASFQDWVAAMESEARSIISEESGLP